MSHCVAKECANPVKARGLCPGHYFRWVREGKPEITAFAAAQTPLTPRRRQASARRQADPAATPRAAAPEPATPRAGGAADDQGKPSVELSVVRLPVGTQAIGVFSLCDHVTIVLPNGQVVLQVSCSHADIIR